MTCIAGLVEDGVVYLGGDGAASTDTDKYAISNPKVFMNKNFLIGYSASFRMGQLLQYKFVPPKHRKSKNDLAYLTTDFIDYIKICFSNNEFDESNADVGGDFLLGYKGNLYSIENTLHVLKSIHNFNAIGSGSSYAIGSMFSTKGQDPIKRIKMALDVASAFSPGVSPPFTILKL